MVGVFEREGEMKEDRAVKKNETSPPFVSFIFFSLFFMFSGL